MADLQNLLGDIHSDEEEAPLASTTVEADDEPWDRERLDLPPALAAAERKQYQPSIEKEDAVEDEEDALQEDDDYAQLKRLWKKELNVPELLPYDAETIGLFLELLEGQEETIDKLSDSSRNVDPALAPLMASIYKMDADRVRFMLTDLTRARLDKIEDHPLYMREMIDNMSDNEVKNTVCVSLLLLHIEIAWYTFIPTLDCAISRPSAGFLLERVWRTDGTTPSSRSLGSLAQGCLEKAGRTGND